MSHTEFLSTSLAMSKIITGRLSILLAYDEKLRKKGLMGVRFNVDEKVEGDEFDFDVIATFRVGYPDENEEYSCSGENLQKG